MPLELLNAAWTWIILQLKKLRADSLMNPRGKTAEFLLGGSAENNRVGHGELLGLAGRQVFVERSPRFVATLLNCRDVEQVFAELLIPQQTLNYRFALAPFQAAKRRVYGVGSFSDNLPHSIITIPLQPNGFNSKSGTLPIRG